MKKILVTILIIAISLASSINASGNEKDEYLYADAWEVPYTQAMLDESPSPLDLIDGYTHEIYFDLEIYKAPIRNALKDYDNLDWEKFENVNLVQKVEVDTLSDPLIMYYVCNLVALYDREQNRIIIMPYYWDMPEDKKVRTITHELIHSLIASSDKAKEGNIEEGLVDYLTQKVMQNLGINIDPTYFIEVLAVNWLNEMFGEQNLINSIRSGAIGEDFNALLKPGTWEKCNYALCEMRLTEESRKNKPNVIYDILAHAAVETGKQREALQLLEQDYIVLQRYGINLDCEYFCKLLS